MLLVLCRTPINVRHDLWKCYPCTQDEWLVGLNLCSHIYLSEFYSSSNIYRVYLETHYYWSCHCPTQRCWWDICGVLWSSSPRWCTSYVSSSSMEYGIQLYPMILLSVTSLHNTRCKGRSTYIISSEDTRRGAGNGGPCCWSVVHMSPSIGREAMSRGEFEEDTTQMIILHAILVEVRHVL